MKSVLEKLIFTLEKIEVNGKNNLDMLLGCILTLEKLIEAIEETETQAENE